MAEEKKNKKSAEVAKMILKYILGILLILLGILAIVRWWVSLLILIKGCVGLFLVLAGIIAIAIAKE